MILPPNLAQWLAARRSSLSSVCSVYIFTIQSLNAGEHIPPSVLVISEDLGHLHGNKEAQPTLLVLQQHWGGPARAQISRAPCIMPEKKRLPPTLRNRGDVSNATSRRGLEGRWTDMMRVISGRWPSPYLTSLTHQQTHALRPSLHYSKGEMSRRQFLSSGLDNYLRVR